MDVRTALKMWAVGYAVGTATLLQVVWLSAFFHGGLGGIDINSIDEMWPEYFLTAVGYALMVAGVVLMIKERGENNAN